jgi:hypothetical protein
MKNQLIFANLHRIGREKGLIGAAISIRPDGLEEFALRVGDGPQLDLDPLRRTSVGGV